MKQNLKNKFKKTISILLSAMLFITVLPATASAEEIPPAQETINSTVQVEGENIEVTITITPDTTDTDKTTTTTETQPGGAVAPSGAEVVYQETIVSDNTVNPDGTQTVTDQIEGSYTYEKESDGTVPQVTLDLITDGEEVENPSAAVDAGLLPPEQPKDEETGEVILDEAVEMTGEDSIYGDYGKVYDNKTITGQPDRIVSADAEATSIVVSEGEYHEENLGDGYNYIYNSSARPKGSDNVEFDYKRESDKYWTSEYAARQVTLSDTNGTPEDKTDDTLFDTAYCIDESTSVPASSLQGEIDATDVLYRIANLEDSGYYPETEDGVLAEDHLRFIVLNGYSFPKPVEGQSAPSLEPNTESLNAVIEMMKNAKDKDGNLLYPDIDFSRLTAVEAANATQMAIWRYGNQEGEMYDAQSKHTGSQNPQDSASAARVNALYDYLIKGTITQQQAENLDIDSTEIINEEKFIRDLSITVGEKSDSEEHRAANTDSDKDNDVYNVDLTFTMYVEPGEKDDLVVSIIASDGTVLKKARIAGDNSNDDANIFVKLFKKEDDPNSYTFKDLKLAENSDISFDLTLEGVQYLKEGVYIYRPMAYTAEDGTEYKDGETSQTFVTKRSGTVNVDVNARVNLKFDVQEADVKIEREWEYQLEYNLETISDEDPGDEPEDEEEDEEKDEDEKPDEPIPLGYGGGNIDTGDPTGGRFSAFVLVNILSGYIAFMLIQKKRRLRES